MCVSFSLGFFSIFNDVTFERIRNIPDEDYRIVMCTTKKNTASDTPGLSQKKTTTRKRQEKKTTDISDRSRERERKTKCIASS